jgi:photosystem II stability/assembly factor-like uncharacterized protein
MKQTLTILLFAVVMFVSSAKAQWTVQHPEASYADLFAVHALDASTFVAVGDHGHILRTTDRGLTWTTVHRGDSSHLLLNSIDFASGTHGAAVGLGCYAVTTDAGLTWNWVDIGYRTQLNEITFVNASDGWIVGENGTLLRTTDGGSTWTSVQVNTRASLRSIDHVDDKVGYIGGGQGVILQTLDGGDTWEVTHRAIPADVIAISFLDAANGVAATTSHSVWRTSDSSKSWVKLYTDTLLAITDISMISLNEFRVTGVRLPDRTGVVIRSTDNGASWSAQISRENTALHAVESRTSTEAVAVGERGLVLSSIDDGATWFERADAPADLRAISMMSTTFGIAVGDRGVGIYTTDGATWTTVESGRPYDVNDVEIGDVLVAVGDSGYVASSTDLGVSWTEEKPVDRDLYSVALGGNNSFAVGEGGTVLRQAAGGSWGPVSSPGSNDLHGVFFNDTVLYVIGENGAIHRATDLGLAWSQLPSHTSATLLDIEIRGDRGWIVGDRGTLLRSSDGGASWNLASETLYETYTSISMTDDGLQGALTTLGGDVYSTSNGGDTWSIGMSAGHPLFASDIVGSEAWVAGLRGVIAHGTLASNSVTRSSSTQHALQVSYSRAELLMTIEADLSGVTGTSIELYDALGKLVPLASINAASGSEIQVRFNQPLSSGLYHLKLRATNSDGEILMTEKILVTN